MKRNVSVCLSGFLILLPFGCGKDSKETKNADDYFTLEWGSAPTLSDSCVLSVPGVATFKEYTEKSVTYTGVTKKKVESNDVKISAFASATGTLLRADGGSVCKATAAATATGASCDLNSFPDPVSGNDWTTLHKIKVDWTVVGKEPAVTKTITKELRLSSSELQAQKALVAGSTLTIDTVPSKGKQVQCSLTQTCSPGTSGSLDLGTDFGCAVSSSGGVSCWGVNNYGQLGVDSVTTLQSSLPVAVPNVTNAKQVATGRDFACALKSDGTVACWGYNSVGQTGAPVGASWITLPTAIAGLANVVSISAGYAHTCALINDGTVSCWGYNQFQQVNNVNTTNYHTPQKLSTIAGATSVAAGAFHTCALINDGTVKCWGRNTYGAVGDGTAYGFDNRTTPATETYKDVTVVTGVAGAIAVTAGSEYSCALINDGTVKCWGYAGSGQLGSHTSTSTCPNKTDATPTATNSTCEPTPVTVLGLDGVVNLAAGSSQTCALRSDGSVWCFGSGGTSYSEIPAVVVSKNALAVSVGNGVGCVLVDGGRVVCWGDNDQGQLGNGTKTVMPTPAPAAARDAITPVQVGTSAAPFTAQSKSCRQFSVTW